MMKKIVTAVLLFAFAASVLAACSQGGEKVMEIPLSSSEASVTGNGTGDSVLPCAESGVDEALFRYIYLFMKRGSLAKWKSYESGGSDLTGDKNISVGDTEDFWNCKINGTDGGESLTFGKLLYDSVCDLVKNMLAVEAAARDYGVPLPDDYKEKLEKALYEDVAQNGSDYLDNVGFADENKIVFDWVKDRRKMRLAVDGIGEADWERVFCRYGAVAEQLQKHLEKAGVLKPEPDDKILEKLHAEYEKNVESNLKRAVKFDFFYYKFRKENASESSMEESSEVSAEQSAEASGEESTEEISADEYNKRLSEKCEEILSGLKDGSLDFEAEAKKAEGSKVDSVGSRDALVQIFGDAVKDCAPGDYVLLKDEHFAFLLRFEDVAASDFPAFTAPDDEKLEESRQQSVAEALEKLLKNYSDTVVTNERLLEKYSKPWDIK